ncbi:uncharacterized protein LOC127705814 [Mytilus californianus]|uniref:uncharacterized protein LOC127705814 n=1 Tax=Mytilus californianus TaxID=6549 RepID=UPI002244FF9A|nr:uncharacterized protein LOC127705814 [Mytilus californianus]
MTIQEIQQKYVNGIWTCMNGKHKFQTEVSTLKGIASATDIFIRGEVLASTNKIQITCYSCRQPYRNTVEFLVDDESVDSITFNRETDTCVNGIGVIHPDKFTCDLSGTIFVHIFERHNKSPGTHFSCDMRFFDTALSSRFMKKATLYFDGKRFYNNGSILEITKHADPPFIDENQSDDINNSLSTTTPRAHDFGISVNSGGRMYLWILVIVLALIVLGIVPFCCCVYRKSKTIKSQLRHGMTDGSKDDELQDTLILLEEQFDSNDMICLPCKIQFKSTLTTELGLDCTEACGQPCINDYSSITIDDAHNFFDIKELPKNYDIPFLCSTHELKLECVCVSHNDVCCNSCAVEMHSECDVEALREKDMYRFGISQTVAEYNERICAVLHTSKNIIQSFRCNIQYIINDRRQIQWQLQNLYENTIRGCKSSPNTKKAIDNDKSKLMLKLKDKTEELISNIKRKISELEEVLHTSIKHDELLNFKFENRCEKHSFLLIQYLDSLLRDSERKLETIIERKSTIRLNYEKYEKDPIKSLGHIYTIKTYERVPHSEKQYT